MKKKSIFHIERPVLGSDFKMRQVVIVGCITREIEKQVIGLQSGYVQDSEIIMESEFSVNLVNKTLYIGYAVTHPDDVFDLKTGIEIATKMATEKPITYTSSKAQNFFTKSMVLAILENKIPEIEKLVNKAIEKNI